MSKIWQVFALFMVIAYARIGASLVAEDTTTSNEFSIRLPSTLKPVHYLIQLQPFINGNFSIDGFVEITFEVVEPTNKIILHIADIITHNDTVKVYDSEDTSRDSPLPIQSQEYLRENHYYIATLQEDLSVGRSYIIEMQYEAYLNENLKGFYRSSYTDDNGTLKWLATTQFQPTDARRAFPCFDEPGFKANFTIHIIRQDNLTTISNMPIAESIPAEGQEGWILDKFETSLPMSTYLVAFIVSDFENKISADSSPNYEFGVLARKQYMGQAEYALKIGPPIMKFYEEFFDVPFPLPKQDMAAVPDFSLGAMENWGLIIYRESRFLYNDKLSTASDKMNTGAVIAHELAHQWFGNLVTPSWWADLWLNEGFASYMEYVGLNAVEPTMSMLQQPLVGARYSAFQLDSLQSSHPISVPVYNPDEINQLFDKISYDKGSSIIRMMNHILTEESFRKGLKNYLIGMSYSAAEQDDLWKYLTEQAQEDRVMADDLTVKDIMDTWTLQMGYPVVHVKNNKDGTAELTQERFLLVESANSNDTHDYKWWIPITFTNQQSKDFSETKPTEWMKPTEAQKMIAIPEGDQWILFNTQATGYYRVNYEEDNWQQIISQLTADHEAIDILNRAQIIDDSLNLARSGRLRYEIPLNILSYLKKEQDYIPIKSALQNLAYLNDMFAHTEGYGSLKNFFLSLIIPHYEVLQFKDNLSDPHLDQLLRANILQWACDLGHQPCIDESISLFNQWIEDPENYELISANLKGVVYCTAISKGGRKEWQFAWGRYEAATISTEKNTILEALGCSSDTTILSEYMNRSLTAGEGIRKQDVRYVIPAIAKTTNGKLPAWQFLRDQWGTIANYFGSIFFTLDVIVSGVTGSLNTRSQLQEIESFREAEKENFFSAYRSVDQAVERTANNLAWMDNYYDVILNWLQENGYQNGF